MEKLPPEIIFPLLRNLNIRDCVRFCSTCRRFNDFLPALTEIFPSFDCQTLHLREKRDLSYAAFLVRHGLSEGVKRIKLNVLLCQDDSTNELRAIFDEMPNRILELESVAGDPVAYPHPSAISVLSANSVQEFQWDNHAFECKLQVKREGGKPDIILASSLGTTACIVPVSLFKFIKSFSLRLSSPKELPSFLTLQEVMPQLSELSLVFPDNLCATDFSDSSVMANSPSWWPFVKKLSLNAGADIASHILDHYRFPHVASVTLDISKFYEYKPDFPSFAHMCRRLPRGLKELHLCGSYLKLEDYHFFVVRTNLEVITHIEYQNVGLDEEISLLCFRGDTSNCPFPTPSSVGPLIRFKPMLFRDMSFKLNTTRDWTVLISLLRLISSLNSLAIVFTERPSMNIEVASPKVTTKVARLFMSSYLCNDKRGCNILSSFEHVAEIICDTGPNFSPTGPLPLAKCQKAESAGCRSLGLCSVTCWRELECLHLEPLMQVLVLTRLKLHVQRSERNFDLNKLLRVVGTKLKAIHITYDFMPRISAAELKALLCNPELETVKINSVCGFIRIDYVIRNIAQEIQSWPPRLKKIILSSHGSAPNLLKPRSSERRVSLSQHLREAVVWFSDIVLEKLNGVLHVTAPYPYSYNFSLERVTEPTQCPLPLTEPKSPFEHRQPKSPFEHRQPTSECHDPYFS